MAPIDNLPLIKVHFNIVLNEDKFQQTRRFYLAWIEPEDKQHQGLRRDTGTTLTIKCGWHQKKVELN